jgi:hypothetical protein
MHYLQSFKISKISGCYNEASSVDAVLTPVGPKDPSTESVAEGATGVAIGEGTTVMVSGTEDP